MPLHVEEILPTGRWLADTPILLWHTTVQVLRPLRTMADAVLGWEERQRRNRYAFADDAERFTLGRFLLRIALASWPTDEVLDERVLERARKIQFTQQQGGALRRIGATASSPSFSLSRSGETLVVGIGMVDALGVDVEKDDRAYLLEGALLNDYFSPEERIACSHLRDKERAKYLLALWTGKEAIVKAAGIGLRAPLREIVLSGEKILSLPSLLKIKGSCSLRLMNEAQVSLAVAWW